MMLIFPARCVSSTCTCTVSCLGVQRPKLLEPVAFLSARAGQGEDESRRRNENRKTKGWTWSLDVPLLLGDAGHTQAIGTAYRMSLTFYRLCSFSLQRCTVLRPRLAGFSLRLPTALLSGSASTRYASYRSCCMPAPECSARPIRITLVRSAQREDISSLRCGDRSPI